MIFIGRRRTGKRPDGCATFWRTSSFEQMSHHRLLHEQHDLADNVALFVTLRPKPTRAAGAGAARSLAASAPAGPDAAAATRLAGQAPDCLLLVANTHVIFDPKRGDAKVG